MVIDGSLSPIQPPRLPEPQQQPAGQTPEAPAPAATNDVHAPNGVTPELWQSLSPEEQAFFAGEAVRGPVAYGRDHQGTPPSMNTRGVRLDVRA